ncbi:ABC transporter ATPase [Metamycoplasma cloacale]|uniref:UvrABC system protein A n=1 Tax=Metamycoplasma cloacale TaxID=92401 RepID=A0A2Z4LML7_9BACT|nr:excinuclease ABC subunit UvrA [Metamycoplasma cloacale]AWX42986.1 excinuclease ABC subunit UvrA [Metamycoplasma cloacale]VEU79190.1 ABC transporter ATPase [Metamycoplasma cloacale]
MNEKIIIKGAKENNLKNVNLEIPRNKLVVFTGVSGSGKSSLAFNTIYEEGRRRYVDSLSNYARQFLGGTKKPNVESIEGLSPAISIEQKTIHNNPRSIVGTVTEIYDYLRLLYARIGKPFCPTHKKEISAQRIKDIINAIFKYKEGSKVYILAPLIVNQKGAHQALLSKLQRDGFLRVRVDNELLLLENEITLDKNKKHNIDLVVDRLVLSKDLQSRINEAIEIALEQSKGLVAIATEEGDYEIFSIHHSCEYGDFDMPKIEPKLFSFNSPNGMCNECKGIGALQKASFDLVCPNKELSINEGAILYYKNTVNTSNLEWQEFKALLDYYQIDPKTPIDQLSKRELELIQYGSDEEITFTLKSQTNTRRTTRYIEGILSKIERRYLETNSEESRIYFKNFLSPIACPSCKGQRLNNYALAVKIANLNIYEISSKSIEELNEIINNLVLNEVELEISQLILIELKHRLKFLIDVGLEYLTLNRRAETLSGGEAQRIRLATQIGSNLTGILYVLDEPSIGLHQKDNQKLLASLKHMVDLGNTLIVVEHDEETIREADYIVDIGLLAGEHGGEIVASGTVEEIAAHPNSLTGKYLSKRLEIQTPRYRRSGNGKVLTLKHAKTNNLQNVTVDFPLGKFIAITGVSGSGKSSLINEELAVKVDDFLNSKHYDYRKDNSLSGQLNIDKIIPIDQSPIGRTSRSNIATYTGVFDDIRALFAQTQEAMIRGYTASRFTFNVSGGRCDKCEGAGVLKIEMHFLPDVYVTCDHCDGHRYNQETLEVKYNGKNINDVLEMTVEQAMHFFGIHSKITQKLQTLIDVGLDYIKLGQPATTLSGGEAQRVKLSSELQKKSTGKTLYLLDEPTTGLHSYDVQKLLNVLNRIVDQGNTVIVIEHNLDVIKSADHIIDLGPGGGKNGGRIVATGTPEQVAKNQNSYTGIFLNKIL